MKPLGSLIVIVVLALILVNAVAFQVTEAEQVIITQFGEPKEVITDPGLHFKKPLIQRVQRLEKRLLPWDGDPENMVTKDKKNIFINVWLRERISVGHEKLEEMMLTTVNASTNLEATYGMEVTDVRIKRLNYVENVRTRVYARMQSERTRIAALFESEAKEEANRILGNMQKERDEIEGEMEQRSAEIRGAADAEVIKIYADALSQDPEFFRFLRQLEAYEATFDEDTRLILSTDNEFLNLLRGPTPEDE